MKIDICFVMDITSSMGPWIQAAKEHIYDIVHNLQEGAEVRIAFVGYRDYGDARQFVCREFANVNSVLRTIQDVEAIGGSDIAEDVAGGLLNARMLVWEEDAAKSLIHIADAPPHGMMFHEPWISDRFPQGDPQGKDPLGILKSLSEDNIDYTFIKINDSTNIMLKEFHDVYTGPGEFQVMDLRQQGVEEFAPAVFRSITQTVTRYSASQDPRAE